jgi:polysaccharide biosynthesis protein PelA
MCRSICPAFSVGHHVIDRCKPPLRGLLASLFVSVCFVIPVSASVIGRDVLALYDSEQEQTVADTLVHNLVELPLNHLGLRVTYWDVAQGMPDWSEIEPDFVVSWFRAPVAEAVDYLAWMREAQRRNIPIATFGTSGIPASGGEALASDLYAIHGVEVRNYVPVTFDASVAFLDADMIGFECLPDPVLPPFPILVPTRADVTSHLTIRSGMQGAEAESSLVTISNAGGLAYANYELCALPELERVQWLLDPFAFFERAYALETWPVPDTTTLSGRRIYFSHIDGDGWNNASEIPLQGNTQPLSAEVVNELILRAFPDFPVGVGLIGGDVDPEFGATEAAIRAARDAFALPNVEIGVHGYSHPFFWWYFEDYDREHELGLVRGQIEDQRSPIEGLFGLLRDEQGLLSLPVISSYDITLPRAYLQRPFSLQEEIDGAIAVANALAPEGKTAQAYYWSGDTRPFPAAMAATVAAGIRNINGGDSRFDDVYPSMAYLSPLGRRVGDHWQVYSGNANDNIYTDGWSRDYHGMLLVRDTVERTGYPRRLKPFNIYYHTFVGERYASVEALVDLLELAATDEFIRVFPSRYIDVVTGFFSAEVERIGDNAWTIRDRGALQTLRIDRPGALRVDFTTSSGVIGQRIVGHALYVTLDPADEAPRLLLSETPSPHPHLVEASWEVTGFTVDGCNVTLVAEGFGAGHIRIADMAAEAVAVVATKAGAVISDEVLTTQDGLLDVRLPTVIDETTTIDIRCLN